MCSLLYMTTTCMCYIVYMYMDIPCTVHTCIVYMYMYKLLIQVYLYALHCTVYL